MHSFLKYFHILVFLLLIRCAPDSPQNIESGKYTCNHCVMKIIDMRFNSQLQTTKGKHFHFDSIECMIEWIQANPEKEIKTSWVKDYSTRNWILAQDAYYLVSPNISSPMGAHLSAFNTKEQIEEIIKIKTGKILKYAELSEYLRNLKHHKHN